VPIENPQVEQRAGEGCIGLFHRRQSGAGLGGGRQRKLPSTAA
jgi:hypothetical protein